MPQIPAIRRFGGIKVVGCTIKRMGDMGSVIRVSTGGRDRLNAMAVMVGALCVASLQ